MLDLQERGHGISQKVSVFDWRSSFCRFWKENSRILEKKYLAQKWNQTHEQNFKITIKRANRVGLWGISFNSNGKRPIERRDADFEKIVGRISQISWC